MLRCVCGEKPVVQKEGPFYDYCYKVVCKNCGLQCPSAGRTEEDAKESWDAFIRRLND